MRSSRADGDRLGRRREPSTSSTTSSSPPMRASTDARRAGLVEARGQGDQQLVARPVPERVVDDLEAVEVEQQHGRGPASPVVGDHVQAGASGPARASSRKAHRLGRPVSGSWRAWKASCALGRVAGEGLGEDAGGRAQRGHVTDLEASTRGSTASKPMKPITRPWSASGTASADCTPRDSNHACSASQLVARARPTDGMLTSSRRCSASSSGMSARGQAQGRARAARGRRRRPLVGVDHVAGRRVEQHDLDPVDPAQPAHLLERGLDAVVDAGRRAGARTPRRAAPAGPR